LYTFRFRLGPHERTKCIDTHVLFDAHRRTTLSVMGAGTRVTRVKNNAR